MQEQTHKIGDIKHFSKSGATVKLLFKTFVVLGGKKIVSWEVERIDTKKKMLCPERSLVPAPNQED